MAEKGNACDDCGLLFDSQHDVQRQMKRGWCHEYNMTSTKRKRPDDKNEFNQPV
jgi:hypothetical protein